MTARTTLLLLIFASLGTMATVLAIAAERRNSRPFRWVARLAEPAWRMRGAPSLVPATPWRLSADAGWQVRDHGGAEWRFGDDQVRARTLAERVWWLNERGTLLWRPHRGDVDVRVHVAARKASNASLPPDAEWQFGGLMLRDPMGERPFVRERYVFVVVGYRQSRLQVEVKDTRDGLSHVEARDWPSGDAELRLRRRGVVVDLAARPSSDAPWQNLFAVERTDLPPVMQLGLVTYAYSEGRNRHDLDVAFSRLSVQ